VASEEAPEALPLGIPHLSSLFASHRGERAVRSNELLGGGTHRGRDMIGARELNRVS
jgi:hypothetical protein